MPRISCHAKQRLHSQFIFTVNSHKNCTRTQYTGQEFANELHFIHLVRSVKAPPTSLFVYLDLDMCHTRTKSHAVRLHPRTDRRSRREAGSTSPAIIEHGDETVRVSGGLHEKKRRSSGQVHLQLPYNGGSTSFIPTLASVLDHEGLHLRRNDQSGVLLKRIPEVSVERARVDNSRRNARGQPGRV
jgi:hypothetical protein